MTLVEHKRFQRPPIQGIPIQPCRGLAPLPRLWATDPGHVPGTVAVMFALVANAW